MGNLSAFMKKEFVNKDTIVEIPGFDRFTDENGKPVAFKVRKLDYKDIRKIRNYYRIEKIAYDKKKNPVVADGILVKDIQYNNEKANANIVVEALAYPDLKNKDLMKFYGCDEYIEMPTKLFTPIEYVELMKRMWIVLGLTKPDDDDDEQNESENENEVETVKNS